MRVVLTGEFEGHKSRLRRKHSNWLIKKIKKIKRKISAHRKKDANF